MVNVKPESSTVNITVSSSGTSGSVNVTPDYAQHYSEKSREWAISNRIVDGVDYSSKYYAGRANQSALNAQSFAQSAQDNYNNFQQSIDGALSTVNDTVQGAITTIDTKSGEAIETINNAVDGAIENIGIEANEQISNIERTGFYMRDDKLYFINSQGEETEFKSGGGGSGFNLFDTKVSDHILEGEEAIGWALQGTYVEKADYPDFYDECIAQQTAGTETLVTLGASTVTMSVNVNGHRFYDIVNKSVIDTYYNETGIADFYGIDTENERVFLPRNKYFQQLTDDPSKVNDYVEAGLPDHRHSYTFKSIRGGDNSGGDNNSISNATFQTGLASASNPIYGNSDTVQPPSSLKLLYYCVGNTEVKQAISNVTELTTTENDTIPLFKGMYFDFKPNNASWLKGGEQKNRAGLYETTYDELVECLTGVNKYDLKVINIGDMVAGVDYSEYWKLDQDNMVFQTPTAISNKALSGAVVGNGMSLGLTNGSQNFGLRNFTLSSVHIAFKDAYGVPVGQYSSQAATNADKAVGVTTDPTKSGIVAEQATAQLYFKVANAVQNLELLNVGEVTEALADKISRQDCPAYITEAYVNGTSGYNLYSNGYCEQWGVCNGSNTNTKTTLLKNYKDTNYIVNISFNNNINSSADVSSFWGSYLQAHNKTVSSFYSFCQGANTQFGTVWRACGYIS